MEDEINKNVAELTFAVIDTALSTIGIPPVATFFNSVGKVVSSIRDEVLIENLIAFYSSANKARKEETEKFFSAMEMTKTHS